jgi:hypothetical protein
LQERHTVRKDADREMLRTLHDRPSRAYGAPDVADLKAIHAEVAAAVRCR